MATDQIDHQVRDATNILCASRRFPLIAVVGILFASVSMTYAAAALSQSVDFDIPAQPVISALHAWSRQSNVQVMMADSGEVTRQQSDGVQGRFTAAVALGRLLQRTNLTYEAVGDSTVAVKRIAAVGAQEFKEPSPEQSRPKETKTSDARRTMEEVVVTAQKREQRLQDVPISVSVLGGAELDRSTIVGTTEALSRVPGAAVNVTYQGGGTQVVMRGVTAGGALFTGSSPIAYYLDSVPFGLVKSAIVPDTNAYDLQRVEVLRGPQGTLYGASAQNGVVRILTHDADLNDFEFKGRTSVSTTERGNESYRGDVAVNIPIVDGKLAARAVLGYGDLGGWIDSARARNVNDAEIGNMRVKVNAQPTDRLSIGMSAWLSRADYGGPSTADENDKQQAVLEEPIETDFDAYGLKVGYESPALSVASMTSYLEYSNRSRRDLIYFLPDFVSPDRFDAEVFSQELILNSKNEGLWRWSLGGMYRDAEDLTLQGDQFLPDPPLINTDITYMSKSFAVFGELTRMILDGKIELTAGLRYFEDDVTVRENYNPDGLPLIRTKEKFDATSPRAVVTWHPSDHMTLYASYAEGFRSGFDQTPRVQRLGPAFPPVKADTLTNYELGTKGELLQGRISIDAALYYIDWQDVQQSLTVNFIGEGGVITPTTANVNGESASGVGFDFGLSARPIDELELGLTLSWNDLTMDGQVFSSSSAGVPVLLFDKGERLNVSPEYTVGTWAEYAFPLGSGRFNGRLSGSANYTSAMDLRTIAGGVQSIAAGDSLLIGNVSFSVDGPGNWSAKLFVDNVNDERGSPVGFPFVPGIITDWDARVRPRTTGMQLEYRFK